MASPRHRSKSPRKHSKSPRKHSKSPRKSKSPKAARKLSAWDIHVKKVRSANPGMSFSDCLKKASASYHR